MIEASSIAQTRNEMRKHVLGSPAWWAALDKLRVLEVNDISAIAAKLGVTEDVVNETVTSWAPQAQRALVNPTWDDHEFAWRELRKLTENTAPS